MAYSCSTHFPDQFSYTTLFISKYHLKVINRFILLVEIENTGFILLGKGPENKNRTGRGLRVDYKTGRGLSS
jgi:hypothetical protein